MASIMKHLSPQDISRLSVCFGREVLSATIRKLTKWRPKQASISCKASCQSVSTEASIPRATQQTNFSCKVVMSLVWQPCSEKRCTHTLFCGLVSILLYVPSQLSTRAVIRDPQGRPLGAVAAVEMPTWARARRLPSSCRARILMFAWPAAAQQNAQPPCIAHD